MTETKLCDIAYYVTEKIDNNLLTKNNYVGVDNMLPNRGGIVESKYCPINGVSIKFQIGDILISNIRPYFKKIWLATFEGGCSSDVLVIRSKDKKYIEYLYAVLSSDNFFNYDMLGVKGSKMPRGDKQYIMSYKVNIVQNYKEFGKVIAGINRQIIRNNVMVQKLQDFTPTEYCISYKLGGLKYAS